MKSTSINLIPGGDKRLFFSQGVESQDEQRCLGHLRGDFGSGHEFWTTWWPHSADKHNDDAFKAEFYPLIEKLRKNLLKNRAAMYKFLADHPTAPLEGGSLNSYGYHINTARYAYYIRCLPERGNYNFYIYCYLAKGDESLEQSLGQP